MADAPAQPTGQRPPPSTGDALAALAGQLDRLQRAYDAADVPALRGEVRGLTLTVAGLAEEVAELVEAGAGREKPPPSWLWRTDAEGQPLTAEAAGILLHRLVVWIERVYIRFPDGALPECWLWHPNVVEELLWLWSAWKSAYLGDAASLQRIGDWHDRQRPGVVRRIAAAAANCSLREHFDPPQSVAVPAADAAVAIAAWWTDPLAAPPVPTGEQVRCADAAHSAVPVGRWP
jgi:hypothetical protein